MTTVAVDVLLAERHRDRFGHIQGSAVDMSLRAWDGLEDWTSPGAADRWAELWLPIDDAAVSASAVSTDAYFSLAVETDGLELGDLSGAELRGVPADEYARRPLAELYRLLGEGRLWADAFAAARDRLSAMAATDVSLGQRHAASEWAASGKVVGYRRTLTGKSCVLCAMASTQRYTKGELAPIHGRCDCGVAPIKGSQDPGRVINSELLTKLKESGAAGDLSYNQAVRRGKRSVRLADERIAETKAELASETDPKRRDRLESRVESWEKRKADSERKLSLRQQQLADFRAGHGGAFYEVHQHGELGPVITRKGDHFQGDPS